MGLGIQTENQQHTKDPFDEFMDSLKQPRQVMAPEMDSLEASEEITPSFEGNPPDMEERETPTEQRQRFNLSMIPAETLVNCVDIAFTQVNSIIAKQKVEGATPEEKDSLIQAAANYMKEKDIDISPSSMLVVMVLVVYGPKVYNAIELRKANEEKEKLQKEVEAQKKRIAELEEQKGK